MREDCFLCYFSVKYDLKWFWRGYVSVVRLTYDSCKFFTKFYLQFYNNNKLSFGKLYILSLLYCLFLNIPLFWCCQVPFTCSLPFWPLGEGASPFLFGMLGSLWWIFPLGIKRLKSCFRYIFVDKCFYYESLYLSKSACSFFSLDHAVLVLLFTKM